MQNRCFSLLLHLFFLPSNRYKQSSKGKKESATIVATKQLWQLVFSQQQNQVQQQDFEVCRCVVATFHWAAAATATLRVSVFSLLSFTRTHIHMDTQRQQRYFFCLLFAAIKRKENSHKVMSMQLVNVLVIKKQGNNNNSSSNNAVDCKFHHSNDSDCDRSSGSDSTFNSKQFINS